MSIKCLVKMLVWLITALASINIGLDALGMGFFTNNVVDMVTGVSGVLSLVLMIISIMCGCGCGYCKSCCSSKSSCSTDNRQNSSQQQRSTNNVSGGYSSATMCGCGKEKAQCGCGN